MIIWEALIYQFKYMSKSLFFCNKISRLIATVHEIDIRYFKRLDRGVLKPHI